MSARARAVVMLAVVGISIPIMGAAAGAKPVLAGSQSPLEQRARVVVPNGARHCPNSGLGASCSYAAVITPVFFVTILPPTRSTLSPSTSLFRAPDHGRSGGRAV